MTARIRDALSRLGLWLLWRGERLWTVQDYRERTGEQ